MYNVYKYIHKRIMCFLFLLKSFSKNHLKVKAYIRHFLAVFFFVPCFLLTVVVVVNTLYHFAALHLALMLVPTI